MARGIHGRFSRRSKGGADGGVFGEGGGEGGEGGRRDSNSIYIRNEGCNLKERRNGGEEGDHATIRLI